MQLRHTLSICLAALIALTISSQPLSCRGEDPAEDKPYRAWKVTTELHRQLVGSKIDNVLVVDADAVCENGVVDPSQLDFLSVTTKGTKQERTALQFVTSRGINADAPARRILELALREFLEELTLSKPIVSWTYVVGQNGFEKAVAGLQSDPADGTGMEENFVTIPAAKIAPVRTPLSRFATGHSDCYIELQKPWEGLEGDTLSEEVRNELKAAIDELDLPRRDKVMLTIVIKNEAGREASDRFVEQQRKAFAADLGFKDISVRNNFR
ncbi:MAG: hypothetical protein ACK5Q5_01875 [Planctomycetaceae bacterium]